jgi:hypothetical protein
MTTDSQHLQWIYDRLINKHGEKPNVDYIIRFKSIIDDMQQEESYYNNRDKGWECPDSPTGYCEYEQEDGSYDEDQCRYCGQPEERK